MKKLLRNDFFGDKNMNKKHIHWMEQEQNQYNIFRNANNDNKKRYTDIFRVKTLESILMRILFLISFLMFHCSYWVIPDGTWRIPMLVMSTLSINISLCGIALIGMKENPYNNPRYLLWMLFFFAVGDILSCFSPFAGGAPYFVAQIIWCVFVK